MSRVLIGMEASGVSREAFRARGLDAWSCDLRAAEDGSPFHIVGDVEGVLRDGWDLAIFHPDCTYMTGAAEWAFGDGPYHQRVKPGTLVGAARRAARDAALDQVRRLLGCCIARVAIENPVGVIGTRIAPASQTLHPYEFGDDASKRTCLWLRGLPLLSKDPARRVAGRQVEYPPLSGRRVERWGNQTDSGQNNLSPGPDRWRLRSLTYPGLAAAFADQWGGLLTGRADFSLAA